MTPVSESTRYRVVAMLVLALLALLGRLLVGSLGGPPAVARGLYLFALGSLAASVLYVAAD